MSNFQIKNLQNKDLSALMQLQHEYARHYPGVQILPGELYLSPAFHQGQDVFCAYHPNGQMLGFAVAYAQLSPTEKKHSVWTEVKILPSMYGMIGLRGSLLDQILKRVRELTTPLGNIQVELNFQYFPYEVESIAFVTSKGFQYNGSIYSMQRDLKNPLPLREPPLGFDIKHWRLETQAEREQYVQARNQCFPDAPISLEEWIYFMSSPSWTSGTNLAAFVSGRLVGCLTTYWDEEQNRNVSEKVGYTEYIFVCPQWRRAGIASALISRGLDYLKENGMRFALLQVKTDNRNALSLYEKLGYNVVQESGIYSRYLSNA